MDENAPQVEGEVAQEADVSGQPQLSDRERVEQEAIQRYRESQKTSDEKAAGMPDGYNDDGTQKEDLIAGKFKSQEELLKAYKELESKLGKPKEESTDKPADKVEEAPTEAAANLQVVKYEQEFADNGSLSDKSYGDLEKMGFTKQQVDQYIQGQQSYANNMRESVYSSVGGQEEYTSIINWASENLPSDIIKDYNDSVDSMNQEKILRNLEYMKFKKEQTVPSQAGPRRLEGTAASSGIQPYGDKNEWQRAQTDRLYGKDAKYTNMVDQRYLAARKRGIL